MHYYTPFPEKVKLKAQFFIQKIEKNNFFIEDPDILSLFLYKKSEKVIFSEAYFYLKNNLSGNILWHECQKNTG